MDGLHMYIFPRLQKFPREQLQKLSDSPAVPQLYVEGEFVGGKCIYRSLKYRAYNGRDRH